MPATIRAILFMCRAIGLKSIIHYSPPIQGSAIRVTEASFADPCSNNTTHVDHLDGTRPVVGRNRSVSVQTPSLYVDRSPVPTFHPEPWSISFQEFEKKNVDPKPNYGGHAKPRWSPSVVNTLILYSPIYRCS